MNHLIFSSQALLLVGLFAIALFFLLLPSPTSAFRNMNQVTRTSACTWNHNNKNNNSNINNNSNSRSTRTVGRTKTGTCHGDEFVTATTSTSTSTCTPRKSFATAHGHNDEEEINAHNNSVRKILDEVSVMFEERKAHVRKLLDDFSQPFMMDDTEADDDNDDDDDDDDGDSITMEDGVETVVIENCSSKLMDHGMDVTAKGMSHFCFLVHGYNGKPADLLYLRSAMVQLAQDKISSPSERGDDHNRAYEHGHEHGHEHEHEHGYTNRMIMHTCQSNWRRTHDGVEKGGERILNEILSVIEQHMCQEDDDNEVVDISVSLVGNSLGGLYSRYAIARLSEMSEHQKSIHRNHDDDDDDDGRNLKDCDVMLMNGRVRVHFNTFCTTATPHLGIAGHTWIPLPRTAELSIGNVMGQTGRDIFRISDLIRTMCTCPTYLKPLASFRKRIAYANAYQTDFVVPTQTAAFLNPDSTYPHHISSPTSCDSTEEVAERDEKSIGSGSREIDDDSRSDRNTNTVNVNANNNSYRSGMVVATLHTPRGEDIGTGTGTGTKEERTDTDIEPTINPRSFLAASRMKNKALKEELLEMSNAMDQLGWKKVIVDLREQMPMSFRIPQIVRKRSGVNTNGASGLPIPMRSTSSDLDSTHNVNIEEESASASASDSSGYHVLESRDVAHAFSKPDDVLAFPLGHNTMVAVEKSIYTSSVFRGGRPLMDDLAKELVDEILEGWKDNAKQ